VLIRFLQRDAPWEAGQEVELEAKAAEKLVRHGVAEFVEPPPPASKKKGGKADA